MTIKTRSLDRAAFFMTFGAVLVAIHDNYPNNVFEVRSHPFLLWYEKVGGWVPYNAFCNQRKKIKRKSRKKAGLPEYFTGHKETGFKIGDMLVYPLQLK